MVSEFQKISNFAGSKFSFFIINMVNIVTDIVYKRVRCTLWITFWIAVFFPCSFKTDKFFLTQMSLESNNSSLMAVESPFENIEITTSDSLARLRGNKFGFKSFSECFSSIVEHLQTSISVPSAFCEPIVDDFHCERTRDSTGSEGDSWIEGYHVNSL